jgi:hypothetical protein
MRGEEKVHEEEVQEFVGKKFRSYRSSGVAAWGQRLSGL